MEKFVTTGDLPSPYERELLLIVMEECAEIQHRCSKALRFGVREIQPGQDFTNQERICQELGDLVAVLELVEDQGIVYRHMVMNYSVKKMPKLQAFLQTRPETT